MDFTDLLKVLSWLAAGPGAVALASWLVGFLAESYPGWHNLPGWVRRYAPLLAAAVFSVAANLLLAQPEIIAAIQPWWAIVVTVIIGWASALSGHSKAIRYGVTARAKNK